MCGTHSFESLRIDEKKAVLEMIRDAIKDYVLSIAKEELQKQYPYSEILTEICKILKCTIEELKEMEQRNNKTTKFHLGETQKYYKLIKIFR